MTPHPSLHRIEPGRTVDLAEIDPADTSAAPGGKEATKAASWAQAVRLAELQDLLWARRQERLLVVLQGTDTAGKGGTIRRVFGAVNPAGLRVVSFQAPTRAELERDYLWRVHAEVPAAGEIGVFDRSHYEDVLVARVEGLVPEAVWQRRFDHINAFERMLVDEGTTIVKVFLHISRDEQAERLAARLADPTKRWKLRPDDLVARRRWDDYQRAYAEAITRTSTEHAPWYVVPADRKWYRTWAVAAIVIEVLERMGLRWPDPHLDLRDLDLR